MYYKRFIIIIYSWVCKQRDLRRLEIRHLLEDQGFKHSAKLHSTMEIGLPSEDVASRTWSWRQNLKVNWGRYQLCGNIHCRSNLRLIRSSFTCPSQKLTHILHQMFQMRILTHANMNVFVGACLESPHNLLAWDYCDKGSLQVMWTLVNPQSLLRN